MKLFIRTIGIDRAKMKIGMANLAYNFSLPAWPDTGVAPAWPNKPDTEPGTT